MTIGDRSTPSGPSGSHAETDVTIVGAGPVGITLANFLGLYGIRTTLVDSREELIDYPRGVGLDDESLRTFQAIGVTEDVLPHTTPNHWLRFMTTRGRCFLSIEPRTTEYGWPRRNAFVQPLVDAALLRGLDRFPGVQVRWGHEATGFEQDDDGVTLHVRVADGSTTAIRSAFLVGCDGGRSDVRKGVGVSWEGRTDPTRWLVVDTANDPVGTPNAYVYCDWRRPHVSIALPHGIRRFEFMILPGEDEDEMVKPDRVTELIRPLVPNVEDVDFIRQRVYTHHGRIAGSFVQGRVMIAGDAAHLMPVWQGQGYNSGIRDAANLGWKLAYVLTGRSDRRLLESYDSERRHHAAAMIQISEAAGALVRPTNRTVADARDSATWLLGKVGPLRRYFFEMRYKPMPRYADGVVVVGESGPSDPAVGRMFPQPRVATREAADVLLDDALGPWFSLLMWGADPRNHLDAAALSAWRGLRARFVCVLPMTQLHWSDADADDELLVVGDSTGGLKSWFDQQRGSIVALRPDRFVAALSTPSEINAATAELARAAHVTPGAVGP